MEIKLNNLQRVTLVSSLKKQLESEEKCYRAAADADIMAVYASTGAKTFDVKLETENRAISIGTASVVKRDGKWEIEDIDEWLEGGEPAGLAEFRLDVDADAIDAVIDALREAGLNDKVHLMAKAVDWWQSEVVEVAGQLVFKKTGEPVTGVCFVPGKTYTQLRPKSLELVNSAARALYGSTPMALLEGGQDE